MKKVLAAIDFSNATDKIIKQVIAVAKSAETEIRLLHVASPEPDFVGDDVGPQVIRDQKAKKIREEHRKIQEIAENLKSEKLEVTPLLVQGPTVDSIIKESEKFGAEIIIIGSHGHSAMYNLLMGSVVEGVIRESKIPVLVVPINKD